MPRAIGGVVAFFFSAYAAIGLFRHWRFRSGAFDLGIFDQLLWQLSRFEGPASSVRGLANMFGDHFDPILLLIVPFYWIAPAPETLLVLQSALFAASIVPVWLFARDRLPAPAALALAVGYALFWGIQRAAEFDFHDYAFAPLLIALAILAIDRQHWTLLWIAAVALTLVKEDLIPVVVMAGVYVAATRDRAHGAALAVFGAVAFVLVMLVVIPWFNAGPYIYSNTYGAVLERPWTAPQQLVTPPAKLLTLVVWLAPFLFLPLFSPLFVLALPLILSRLLSETPNHWATGFHYSAPIAPILAMSAADGLARVTRYVRAVEPRRLANVCAALSIPLAAFVPGHQPLWELLKPEVYARTATHRSGEDALTHVPRDATVVAQSPLVPHLTHREQIHVLRADAPDADFVIAAEDLNPWPLGGAAEVRALLDERRQRGYQAIFEKDGWTVLRR